MVKKLYFDYCALAILALLLITSALKHSLRGRTNRSFLYLLLTVTYATLYDICAVLLDNHGAGAESLKYILHCGYLIIRNFIPVVYVFYIIALTDTWHLITKNKFIHILSYLPFSIIFICTIFTPFTKLMFYLDEKTVYTRGPLFFLYYINALFYMLYAIVYSAKYLKQLTVATFISLMLIVPMQVFSIVIQYFEPTLLVEMLFSAVSILFVMLTIQRPDAMSDQITGLFKTSVYTETIRLACLNKKNIRIIYITVTNYLTIQSYLNYENASKISYLFGRRLVAIADKLDLESAEIYYLGNGRYSILLENNDIKKSDKVLSLLKETLANELISGSLHLTLPANIWVINIPDDIEKYEEFLALEKDIIKMPYTPDIIEASSILKNKNYTLIANMDTILSDAIKNRSFEVYYQPIYSITENKFTSAEALIRLNTEEYGFIRPDLFIPIAEENGMISDIDDIVFEEVCKFISSEDFYRLHVDYIEVNLSVVQCMQPDLADRILGTMHKYSVRPSQINLEITETAAEYSQTAIDHNINTLTSAGISFSLDDFGTGYSNMVRIASLPLHIVKLDRSFTFTDGNDDLLKLLNNTVDMIKKMDLKIVVEGVETEDKLNQFKALECDYIQGYYFSKPLPKDQFVEFIRERQ